MADEKYGIPTGMNSSLIQNYLQYSDNAIAAQRGVAQRNIDESRSAMYDALGRMQLQTERDIAKRRTAAQRSGMTSSALAAYEMQNIMTGQLGAQQIAQTYRQEQAALEQQYAGAEDQTRAALFEVLNNNAAQVAAVDAQRYSASAIDQIKQLFPNATPEQLNLLARQYMGFELSKTEKNKITYMSNVEDGGTDNGTGPTTYSAYLRDNSESTTDDYKMYLDWYNKKYGTSYYINSANDTELRTR